MRLDSLIRAVVLTACTLLAIPAVADADVFVADFGAFGGSGGIIRVDSTTGARTTVSENSSPAGGPAFLEPLGVVIAPNGDLLVADQNAFGGGGGVIRVNPVTGQRTTVSENASPAGGPQFVDPFALTLAANGDILVSDQNAFGGGGGVIRVDPVTGVRTTVTQNGAPTGGPSFDAPFGITTEANGSIVVADSTLAALVRVDPATGSRTVLSNNSTPPGSPNFDDPYGIARAASGDIIVGDGLAFPGPSAGLIRTNPLTGARAAITQNTAPAGGPSIVSPTGVALASNGDILVADGAAFADGGGGIIRVDPVTGARSTLSENAAPVGGPAFVDPFGLAIQPDAAPPPPPPPPPPPGPLPRPVLGVSANVTPLSGTVLIALPRPRSAGRAHAAQKGLTFVPLTEARQIPIGSFLDTKRGRVRLTTATPGGRTQTGDFSRGLFQTLQSRKRREKGLTELRLKGSSFTRCNAGGKRATASGLSRRTIRRLRGSARGRFRTRGRNSSATVRGTIWTVADRCDGTLTTVQRGRVAVRDFRKRKTIVVRAGKRYLARARAR